jgi:hypothetical protein
MTWSYSGDPSTTDKDAVRYLSGDTNETASYTVLDEEIAYSLTRFPAVDLAAAEIADVIAGKLSGTGSCKVGDVSRDSSMIAENFRKRAKDLRRGSLRHAVPFVGGRSKDEKRTLAEDTDLVQPAFAVRMDDNPGQRNLAIDPRLGSTDG